MKRIILYFFIGLFLGGILIYGQAKLLYILAFIFAVLSLYLGRKNIGFKILNFFLIVHLIRLYDEFILGNKTTYYGHFYIEELYYKQLLICFIFIYTIFSYLYFIKEISIYEIKIKKKKNNINFILSILIGVSIILLRQGNSIFQGNLYNLKNSKVIGGFNLYEYFLIFIILSYKYSTNKKEKIIMWLMILFYFYKTLSLGGRIEILQSTILLFLLYKSSIFSLKKIIISLPIYIYMNDITGFIRNDLKKIIINPKLIFDKNITYIGDKIYKPSTDGEVFYSSVLMLGLIKENVLTFSIRIKSYIYFILSLLIPSKFISSEQSNLSRYTRSYYPAGGGGFIGTYFFIWLGYFGIILIGLYLCYILNLKNIKKDYIKVYLILVIAFTPRWLIYSPLFIFKLCFVGSIVWIFFDFIDQILIKNKIKKNEKMF